MHYLKLSFFIVNCYFFKGLSVSSMDSKLRVWDVDEGVKCQEI